MKEQSFAARHIGRIPERYRQFRYIFMERERLARDLHTALGKEDYEEAARIHADILKMDAQEGTEDDTEQS
jgi:protein-arginine kinase activator protein McsA